jgi:eukaryotic-like serine/threonine-protein kinase
VSLSPPAPSVLAPGFKLDRYELLCPIAEGGMASVWIARQSGKHGFRKLVAVKTILPKYAEDERFQSMFVDEARIASRIEHPNVTQILDVGDQHGVTYLVMEYVDGDALSRLNRVARKRGQALPLGVVLRVMADVCGGLHAAHELKDEQGAPLGVVHRDVSPQNVLVTTKGIAKLIDFGIAKARDRLSDDTSAGQVKGKVAYMAPEQAFGRPVDGRADVWAVGAVLYHLIAGRPPFEAENDIQTLFKLSSGRPPMPLPPGTPPAVAAVVQRCLLHAPEARFATAAELQAALEEAMVEASLPANAATVGACVADLMGERTEKRKESIALGLKAAEEREKVAVIMQRNAETTSVTSDPGARPERTTGVEHAKVITAGPESERSSATGQTLGSAAMSVPAEPRRRRSGRAIAAGVFVAAVVMSLGVFATRSAKTPSGAARGPVASAPVPPVTATIPPPAASTPRVAPSASVADDAPSASSAPTAAPGVVRGPVPRWGSPPPVPPTTTKPSPNKRINDGF